MSDTQIDVLLVGGGIMSATLGALLARLAPEFRILMVEALDQVTQESSGGWNNAGTGHAGYCELNYTPRATDGSVDIARALAINAAFETSLQFWSALVEQGALPAPQTFINATPHLSFVWGDQDISFLRERHARLHAHPLFADMTYSEDAAQLRDWMPLIMRQRDPAQKLAATRVHYGADIDFGALTRSLVEHLQQRAQFELKLSHPVQDLERQRNGRWKVHLRDNASGKSRTVDAGFVFLGAGGGALSLLQKSGIPESRGYGGFPVSGQWLVCNNPELTRQHCAKVYGKAPLGAPPMSVPHLDTRIINGQPALLFGPYAGFTTKFLKRGSYFDLLTSVGRSNLKPLLAAGLHNLDLTRYLIGEAFQSHDDRMAALRRFIPDAQAAEWTLAMAGKRVQVIKPCDEKGGRLEFGTEIVASGDGSLAALLGASPGASTSVPAMITVLQRCFPQQLATPAWQTRLQAMIPAYGASLIENTALLKRIRARTLSTLALNSRP